MGKKTTSKRKQEKYAAHPQRAIENKRRRVAKHIKNHPLDKQGIQDLDRIGG